VQDLPETLQYAPMPLLIVNSDDVITTLNDAAAVMGFQSGDRVADYINGMNEPFCEHIRYQPSSTIFRFRFMSSVKPCKVTPIAFAELNCLWLQDISEHLALAEQLRQVKKPESMQFRQINQLIVTAMGYSELLDVVMSDDEALSADKLSTVKQYQLEITRNLRAIQDLIDDKEKPQRRGSILVIEQHETLAELISELLRGEGYKTTAFSDAGSALKFATMNAHILQLAIVDETMSSDDGSLLDALKMAAPELPVLRLTDEGEGKGTIRKPLDFNQLLRAVQEN
jgi:CheY-like chemotaxis protein